MVSVVVVNRFQNRELSSGQIEKQFREGLRCSGTSNVDMRSDSIPTVLKVDYVSSIADVGKLLQRTMKGMCGILSST